MRYKYRNSKKKVKTGTAGITCSGDRHRDMIGPHGDGEKFLFSKSSGGGGWGSYLVGTR